YNSARVNWTGVNEMAETRAEASGRGIDLSNFVPPVSPASDTVYALDILSLNLPLINDYARGGQRQWNITDQFSVVRGRHLLSFGADYRHLRPSLSSQPFMVGALYSNLDALAAKTPLALSVSARNSISLRLTNLSAFAQDSWRLASRLTLNYGL